jgi:hypothetical protein
MISRVRTPDNHEARDSRQMRGRETYGDDGTA